MAPRSRTGCLTCRQRKLKCDEQRPVCGQCTKAKRECFPSSGITFRHQQNPSMNGASIGSGGLENFYGYKETFRRGTTWVSIPKSLTFVHTSNPYEDDEDESNIVRNYDVAEGDNTLFSGSDGRLDDSSDYTGLMQTAQAAYPAYATHGLEALSAVASQDQYSYAPPPATMSQHSIHGSPSNPRDTTPPPQDGQTSPSPNLDFILHAGASASAIISSSPTVSNIDPRLHAEMAQVRQGSNAEEVTAIAATAGLKPISLEDELRLRIQS